MTKKLLLLAVLLSFAVSAHAQTVATPSITGVSMNATTFAVGSTLSATWSKQGTFPATDSYFVFLKNKSDQLLGSHVSVQGISFTSLAFWQPTLPYPTLTFPMPFVASGTYYLEVDFVDQAGHLITGATSQAFAVTPLVVTLGSPAPSQMPLTVAQRLWVAKVESILSQLSPLLAELSAQGVR